MSETITDRGSRADQLAGGIQQLAPGFTLLGRFHSDLAALAALTDGQDTPVIVEWQGGFERPDRSTFDVGHFSIIVSVASDRSHLTIIDPDDSSLYRRGRIDAVDFLERWWEDNLMEDGAWWRTYRFSAVVVPAVAAMPYVAMGYEPVDHELLMRWGIRL